MRQYEPIWCRIKSKNTASIATSPRNAARVIKAVIKEKNMDEGYKFILAEKALISTLKITKEPSLDGVMLTIHFSLIISIKESYIGVSNL